MRSPISIVRAFRISKNATTTIELCKCLNLNELNSPADLESPPPCRLQSDNEAPTKPSGQGSKGPLPMTVAVARSYNQGYSYVSKYKKTPQRYLMFRSRLF